MLSQLARDAAAGRPVFITDLRSGLAEARTGSIACVLVLPDGDSIKTFEIPYPTLRDLGEAEREMLVRYVRAEIYNHLTTLGGYSLTLYLDTSDSQLVELVNRVIEDFQLDRARDERTAFARIINVLDRMNDALHPEEDTATKRFTIDILDRSELPAGIPSVVFRANPDATFRDVTGNMGDSIVCGLDIGGTDIKGALAVNGRLIELKEYDWNPAAYGDVEQIIDPIVVIARLLRARAALESGPGRARQDSSELAAKIAAALAPHAAYEEMREAADLADRTLGDELRGYDAIGLCFPDVVVQNRIVGGEVPKTRGMRGNSARDFEEQFGRLSGLSDELRSLCGPDGVVMNTNDGPMAAFTAAVEIAASPTPELGRSGVFAHTLGTDLGTGIALADGAIPEIPLEVYNLILDLGSDDARALPAEDLRSIANTNTGVAGTPQKLASQAGAFRLADRILAERAPDLLRQIEEHGFIVSRETGQGTLRTVPEEPVDQRKPYLAYLMDLAGREEAVAEVFRTIGEYMAVVFHETEHILQTGLSQRFLFGRFVKVARCFGLMQEGASRRESDLEFVAADSSMAYTPLMRALDAHPDYTVAQFGQAVGAIYFANLGLIRPELAG